MASGWYLTGLQGVMNGSIDLVNDTLKIMLVNASYTPDDRKWQRNGYGVVNGNRGDGLAGQCNRNGRKYRRCDFASRAQARCAPRDGADHDVSATDVSPNGPRSQSRSLVSPPEEIDGRRPQAQAPDQRPATRKTAPRMGRARQETQAETEAQECQPSLS
jgi:hypothetical protein